MSAREICSVSISTQCSKKPTDEKLRLIQRLKLRSYLQVQTVPLWLFCRTSSTFWGCQQSGFTSQLRD